MMGEKKDVTIFFYLFNSVFVLKVLIVFRSDSHGRSLRCQRARSPGDIWFCYSFPPPRSNDRTAAS